MAFLTILNEAFEGDSLELRGPITIGRLEAVCDVVIRDPKVSRRHCRIEPCSDGWTIIDLGSQNGTRVGGKIVRETLLKNGDEIQVGDTVLWLGTQTTARRRPADPAQALRLARAGVATLEMETGIELWPRPMPRAWREFAGTDHGGGDDGDAGLSDTSVASPLIEGREDGREKL